MRPERLADREITELHSGDPPLSDRNAVTRRSHPTGRVQRASSLFPWRLPSAARSRHEGGRGGGTIASGPAAPSTIGMMMAEVHGRSSPHCTPWLRSLIAADTCADVRVFVGRRLLPAGPPAEERMGGGEGRERPGLPRIWVGQARRAGSLTPRVSVQIVRTNAARIASRSAPGCVHRSRSRSRRPSCS